MATLDIVDLATAATYLGNPNQKTDVLEGLVTAASAAIDDVAGPVVERQVVDVFDGKAQSTVVLRTRPVASITSVDEYVFLQHNSLTAETNLAKPGLGYLFNRVENTITRRAGGLNYLFWPGGQNVVVTYQAGRFADTASVDERFKQACLITVAHIWRSQQGTPISQFGIAAEDTVVFGSGFAVPRQALELLGLEAQLQIGIA